ncbi:MAG: hypothetical protein WC675_05390 [Patescibacteria group bacterium]|jgi:hypothetical protein
MRNAVLKATAKVVGVIVVLFIALIVLAWVTEPTVQAGVPATVNHGLTLEEMIQAANVGWVNPDINSERFPVETGGIEEVTVDFLSMDLLLKLLDGGMVVEEIGKLGYRPATHEEVLASAASQPEFIRQFLPIAVLQPIWTSPHGNSHFIGLLRVGSRTGLDTIWLEGSFRDAPWNFAVVKTTPGESATS